MAEKKIPNPCDDESQTNYCLGKVRFILSTLQISKWNKLYDPNSRDRESGEGGGKGGVEQIRQRSLA